MTTKQFKCAKPKLISNLIENLSNVVSLCNLVNLVHLFVELIFVNNFKKKKLLLFDWFGCVDTNVLFMETKLMKADTDVNCTHLQSNFVESARLLCPYQNSNFVSIEWRGTASVIAILLFMNEIRFNLTIFEGLNQQKCRDLLLVLYICTYKITCSLWFIFTSIPNTCMHLS